MDEIFNWFGLPLINLAINYKTRKPAIKYYNILVIING